jgi:hypothetical protein
MEIFSDLRDNAASDHWIDGLQWFAWSVLCGLFPMWATAALLLITREPLRLSNFTDHGEFLLYTASYVGGALYLVLKDFRKKAFPSRSPLTFILCTILILSTLYFGAITLIDVLSRTGVPQAAQFLNVEMLRFVSIALLPVSCILGYVINVADNVRYTPNIQGIQDKQFQKLSTDFDKL